jgi:RHS repeat-associated protein
MKILRTYFLGVVLSSQAFAQSNPGWIQGESSPENASEWIAQQGASRSAPSSAAQAQQPLSDHDAAASLSEAEEPAPSGSPFGPLNLTAGGNEADEVTPEIETLARGLRNDPIKIFEYVHNFIRYEAYFGSKKGAHLTLLEGSGNEHDQCALLVALLRAADLSPSYKYGPCIFSFGQIAQWLGIDTSPFSHWTDAQMISYYYPSGGAPAGFPTAAQRENLTIYEFLTPRGYPYVDAFSASGTNWFSIPHVWVELDGKKLSPAYKYNTVRSGLDLAAATGYSRSQILGDVGGTTSGDGARWVSGLSYSALASRLGTYTQNFTQAIRANHDWRHSDRITESVVINRESYGNLDPRSVGNPDGIKPIFPDSFAAGQWLPFETWSAIPVAHMSKLEIRAGVWNESTETWTSTWFNQTVNLPALRGRKLSLAFSGNTASIRLDETLIGSAFTVPTANTDFDLRLGVTHNHYELEKTGGTYSVKTSSIGKSNQSETKTYLKGDDCAYALIYSFGNPERLSRVRQEQLDTYRRAGVADTDWRVRTESLNVIGLNWMHQCYQSEKIISGLYRTDPLDHHAFGRVGQERSFNTGAISFYIDVGLIFSARNHRTTDFAEARNCSYLTTTLASAMEHGVLEQMQGTGLGATSTVKMVHLANLAGQRIYRATKANWSAVNSELQNYPAAIKTEISDALNDDASSRGLLPRSGKLVLNQYTGFGFALEEPDMVTMKIGANYGGYNSQPGSVSTAELLAWLRSDSSYLASSSNLSIPADPLTVWQATFGDPVDVATGAWISQATDLALGSNQMASLAFTRSYNSNASYDQAAGLGYGWTHDHHITATRRSGTKAGLGATTSYQAAPFFTALAVASDLSRNHTTSKEWSTAALALNWAVDQLSYKAVAIEIGNKTLEFTEMPDGSFEPPAGMNLTLVGNGSGASEYFTLTERHGPTMTFRTDGLIDKITDLHGNVTQYTYASGKLSKVADAFGHEIDFGWSGSKITSVSDNTSRTVGLGYTGDDLTTVTDVEAKTMTYEYDAAHRVTRLKDAENRITIENDYDTKGRVIVQRNKGDAARTYNLYYSGYCNIEENPLGGTISHYYDSRGRVVGSENALGQTSATSYDGQDRRILHITPEGEISDWFYDSDNNLTAQIDPRGEQVDYHYDAQLRLEETVDQKFNSSFFTYTTKHQLETVTDQEGNLTSYGYHANGFPHTVTDGENKITTTTYDTWGNVNKVTAHDSTFQTFTNNARGDVLTGTDAEGRTTTSTWNKRRQPLNTTLPAVPGEPAAVIIRTYDDSGNLATGTDAKGNLTSHTWNSLGNPLTTTLPALPAGNNALTTGYDLRDWSSTVTNSLSHVATTEYDAAQRVTAIVDALTRRTENTFDANGRMVESEDPLNRVTKSSWTDRGETESATDGENHATGYLYDESGNRTQLTNRRGKVFAFGHDDANRPTSTTTPTGKTTSMTYFDNGLVETIEEPSTQTTTLAYNGKNLVSSRIDPTGTITFGYDDSGLLKTVTEGADVITRTYDERGRLKTFTTADGDLLQYRYDANDNLTKLIYPDGRDVDYTHNSRNLLESVTDWNSRVTTYIYDRLGRLTGITRPNGTSCTMTYDAGGQMLDRKESADGKLFSYLRFSYDAAGQIDNRFRAPIFNSGWQHPDVSVTYDDDNRLLTFDGQSVTHDSDGNMTVGSIREDSGNLILTYNSRNQLTNADGLAYVYDAEGRRRTITDSAGVTRDVIDPNTAMSRLLVRHQPDGSKTFYVYGLGLLYEVDEVENTKTHHFDQVGSTIARTDDSGSVVGRAEYSAYGLLVRKEGEMETPFFYNGQFGIQTDPNGLLCMRARYYSPYLMRFLNADPIGFSGGSNWFAYADGNPVSKYDPSGLVVETVWDIANVGMGAYSFGDNINKGNYGWAAVDALGLVYDGAATAVPFLPAGASAGLKAYRAGNTVVDSTRVAHDIAVVADKTHDAARGVDASLNARRAGTEIHQQVAGQVDGKLWALDSTYMAGANGASGPRPDLLGTGLNLWGDVTTSHQRAWPNHVNLYGNLGEGIPILYQRGTGVTNYSRLTSGAGLGLTGLQNGLGLTQGSNK